MTEEYKCKDCKWLTGRKNIRGIECMNPVLQEKWNKAKTLWMGELRKDTARYKQRNAPACKKFEAKESKPMSRYIDADNAIERLGTYLMTDAQIEYGGLASEDIDDWKPIAIDILKGAPSIDIVRCKECKHWRAYETWSECELWTDDPYESAKTKADDFCSYGERRNDG